MYKVQKRNGAIVSLDQDKIKFSLLAALKSVEEDADKATPLMLDVLGKLEQEYENSIPTVERIQDITETVLMEHGEVNAAKSYILYRERRSEIREDKKVTVEVEKTMEEYLKKLDWRVNANSNQGYSLGGMILNTSGKVTANYWLSHIYPQAIGNAHRNGDYHIHDLDMFSGYCAGWSLRTLLEYGFGGVEGRIQSAPPKNLTSAVSQMVNFLGTLQNEWAGAQAFSSFDTYLAPFVKKYALEVEQDALEINPTLSLDALQQFVDKKTYQYVHQNIQGFVFNLNVPSRWGTQTPFTNITLDWICPKDLRDKRLALGGREYDYTYGELQKEMDMINKAYIEVMTAGDEQGRVFTFPIPTYNIVPDFSWDSPNADLLFEMTAKYGMPYFQNFLNSDLKPEHVRSMCCRLQLDLNELLKRGGGLFGSAEMTGSIGVVTLNTARLGYENKGDMKGFLQQVDHLMELAKTSLEIKRVEVQKWIDAGLFPYTKHYLSSLRNHFSTIGLSGLNEAVRNFSDDTLDLTMPEGIRFAEEVLDFMREKLTVYQNETGNLYNLEATPAEGATYRFAKEDQKRYPDILQAGSPEAPYYTNSSQFPVEYTDDPFEALTLQDTLQTKYTGGTVLHLYMRERMSDSAACKAFVKKALENFRLPYITVTPTFSICPKHGYLEGEQEYCPKCDKELE